jgi:hypothetical protein
MTEEEADALDELYTKNPPTAGPNGTGFFARHKAQVVFLDDFSAKYLRAKSLATKKTMEEIISELIRKELTSA